MPARGILIHTSLDLVTEDCLTCGMVFAFPGSVRDELIKTKGTFYCPFGHKMNFTGPTEAQKERKARLAAERALEEEKARLVRERARVDQLQATAATLRRSRSALKGEVTKARKRAARTQCPVADCKRTFAPTNMQRHVESEHPHWHPEPVLEPADNA
jgi:hypothetical protein